MNKGIIRKTVAVLLSIALTFAYIPETAHAASKKLTLKNCTAKKYMTVGSVFTVKANVKASNLKFTSKNKNIVDVNEAGLMTAKKSGTAKITIKYGTKKKTVTVKVTKKPVGFSISKKSGTYKNSIKVKVKAKKKYNVYYKTGRKYKKGKVIKAGKSQTFLIKKTKSLSFYAVKKTTKMTTKKLNKKAKKAKTAYTFKYVVSSDSATKSDKNTPKDDKAKNDKSDVDKKDNKDGKTEEAKEEEFKNDKDIMKDSPYDEADLVAPEIIPEDNSKIDEEASIIDATTPVATCANGEATVLVDGVAPEENVINISKVKEVTRILIAKDGTYAFAGEIENAIFAVTDNVKANIIFKDFTIDDTKLAEVAHADNPVISLGKGSDVKLTLIGENTIKGSETYVDAKNIAAVISQKAEKDNMSTLTILNGGNGVLNVIDGMDKDADFGGKDPADGIMTKGTLVVKSGNVNVTTNGDCLKGTGFDGVGGVKIEGGNLTLTSNRGAAIKSKNGTVDISGGVIDVLYAADDAINAKNYAVNISGGYLNADYIYGDGIQANDVNISGGDIVIKTYFENAGLNYYNKDLGEGNYNTNVKRDNFVSSSKNEYINVDTGSHKGIKAGSKDYYYTYKTVEEGSKKVAGEEYHEDATGSLNITGGNIFIDTTNTGIKYTAGGPGMMPPMNDNSDDIAWPDMQVKANEEQPENPGQGQQGEGFNPGEGFMPPPPNMNVDNGNLTTAGEGQLMLGCPEDGIKSQTSFAMSGGKLVINASDDGISVIGGVTITGDSKVYINKAYEGLEAKDIVLGTKDGNDSPYLYAYTNDDGINATEKYKVEYIYEDETEEKYERNTYSRTGGSLTIYNGEINISIADDKEQEYSLPVAHGFGVVEDGSVVSGSFKASGDGIDCNGSMYAYGGRVVVFGGAASTGNSPIDCNDTYYIGEGAVVYAAGDMGMPENPTELKQPVIIFGGNNGMPAPPPGFDPGDDFMPPPPPMGDDNSPSALGIEAGSTYKIVDSEGNVVLTGIATKKMNYLLLSTPEIKDGVTYTLIAGEVSTETTATTVAEEGHGFPGQPPQGGFPGQGEQPANADN